MANGSGWSAAGEALGSILTGAGREDAFQAGRYRSAQTEQALASARKAQEEATTAATRRGLIDRVANASAQELLSDELMAAVIAGGMGGDFSNYGQGRLRNQEYDFRARAADESETALSRMLALGAVDGKPYSPLQAVGSGGYVDLRSDDPTVETTPLGASMIGQNEAQAASAFASARAADALATQRQQAPAGPKAPTDMQYVTDADGTTRLEAIPGGRHDPIASAERKMLEDMVTQYPRTRQRYTSAVADADRMLAQVDRAMGGVDWKSTGFVGQFTSKFGGTPARDLRALIDPILANLGFTELNDMRQESPTGGALGQVAVRELEMLQSVVQSLDQAQTAEQMAQALQLVRVHYENFKRAAQEGLAGVEQAISTGDPSGLRARGLLPGRGGAPATPAAPTAPTAAPGAGSEQVVEVPGVGRVTVRVRQ